MRATIRTAHEEPAIVAAAIQPDNTADMQTTTEGDRVVTVIERETTGGLHATVDDYVVNLEVATAVQHAVTANQPMDADRVASDQSTTNNNE